MCPVPVRLVRAVTVRLRAPSVRLIWEIRLLSLPMAMLPLGLVVCLRTAARLLTVALALLLCPVLPWSPAVLLIVPVSDLCVLVLRPSVRVPSVDDISAPALPPVPFVWLPNDLVLSTDSWVVGLLSTSVPLETCVLRWSYVPVLVRLDVPRVPVN